MASGFADVSASTLLSTILLSKKIQAFLGRYPLADKTALETDKAGERNAPKTANINTALIVSVGDSAREADDFSVLAIRAWAEIGVGHEAIISTSVKHRGQRIGGAERHRPFLYPQWSAGVTNAASQDHAPLSRRPGAGR